MAYKNSNESMQRTSPLRGDAADANVSIAENEIYFTSPYIGYYIMVIILPNCP